jgi:hypothetical protein
VPPELKKDWVITQAAFDRLLRCFDSDRDRAAEKYESVRQRLTKLFKWRGCQTPEELADTTIDRVARRLNEDAALSVSDPYLYFHGVALNVLREYWKSSERGASSAGDAASFSDPAALQETESQRSYKERKLECLDNCLRQLATGDRNLVRDYHRHERRDKIELRQALAKQLRVPINALRIRVYRIRVGLEKCIGECTGALE